MYFSLLLAFILGVMTCFGLWSVEGGDRVPFLSLDLERPDVFPLTLLYPWHLPEKGFP